MALFPAYALGIYFNYHSRSGPSDLRIVRCIMPPRLTISLSSVAKIPLMKEVAVLDPLLWLAW